MRILFLGNNWVGWQIARWLRERDETIVGAVVHASGDGRYAEEIVRDACVDGRNVFDAAQLDCPEVLRAVRALQPEIGVVAFLGHILRPEFIDLFPAGCINVHPAYLPYNRGAYPNVWSIVEQTPAGATIHYLDEGIDTGDIIARRSEPVEPVDTGRSLYRKLELLCVDLFKETW
ncbi:MAG: formyltransferase family protein, partial [Planctomycetota bacterium]